MLQSDYLDAWRPPKDFTQILDFTLAFPTVKLAPLLFCLYAVRNRRHRHRTHVGLATRTSEISPVDSFVIPIEFGVLDGTISARRL